MMIYEYHITCARLLELKFIVDRHLESSLRALEDSEPEWPEIR